ncbi:MAG: hypothetical protein JXB29_00520 [Sedimentisphaerales bacterium]|nr:hypothetical protein [Sedimentisphaerales bacterium]
MAKRKKTTKSNTKKTKPERIQCHFVSNTHWDREWRFSFQRTRHMLVYMMDMLLDILKKKPDYKSFHLDSQTVPIQDYLEVRPYKKELIEKYVKEERLLIGPWFCLPDEFCVGGEMIVRNLLLGHKIGRRFGKVTKTGYSPFSWGQLSQLPQIYRGFGIDFASFYRGINPTVVPKSEFIWEGADGSRVVASKLSYRPRYNIWYVVQRPVYWNLGVGERILPWKGGHGPFKLIDEPHCELGFKYTHPRFEYHKEHIAKYAQQALDEQTNWTTQHRFWSCSHDISCPDFREVKMIKDCNEALADTADVFHSTFADFQKGIIKSVGSDVPVLKGEMRHHRTDVKDSKLFGGVISARTHMKQDNFRTERAITNYAEPWAVFASLVGAPYPQSFVDLAYNWLLQNHGHDSIGGCARDVISEDMIFRTRQTREISSTVLETAIEDIIRSIDLSERKAEEIAVTVFNPSSFARTEVSPVVVEIPKQWECEDFELVDEKGRKVAIQPYDKAADCYTEIDTPTDVPNYFFVDRCQIRAEFKDIPAFGYRTFFAKPVKQAKFSKPKSMLSAAKTMENEFIAVTINSNGTVKIRDKKTGKVSDNLGYFRDESAIGHPWKHFTVPQDSIYTTLDEKAQATLIENGSLQTSFRVIINWALPEGTTRDRKARSERTKPFKIVNTVTLRRHQRWVEITTEIDNNVLDHYLEVCFGTKIKSDKIMVQGQFDVIERSLKTPDYSKYTEQPTGEHPMNSFVDVSDGKAGLALFNEGLKAYRADGDDERTVGLVLLRSFPMKVCAANWIDISDIEKGSQCQGKHSFRYGIMPHTGDWEKANIWQASEGFNLAFVAAQVGPTKHGTEALSRSFLEIKPDNLHVSAIKQSETGRGWVVRVFNPFDKTVRAKIRLNDGLAGPTANQSPIDRVKAEFVLPKPTRRKWKKIRMVSLEEVPQKNLKADADGWVSFSITKKKIITVEFIP